MASMLIKVAGDGSALTASQARPTFGADAGRVQVLLKIAAGNGQGVASGGATWLAIDDGSPGHGFSIDAAKGLNVARSFDAAHDMLNRMRRDGHDVLAIEPDVEQVWPWVPAGAGGLGFSADGEACTFADQNDNGGREAGPGAAWHLGDGFTGLASARASVADPAQRKVRVAHLDTGFDPDHSTRPTGLNLGLAANVTGDGPPNDAVDRIPAGQFLASRGHGTATLALLAGAAGTIPSTPPLTAIIGGAPGVEIVPVRIADWVVRFSTRTMVAGIAHAIACKAHVLSMSMGGVPSQALADAVNMAWESGLVMVTAAGNNYSGLPLRSVVYPARYDRVIAACGVMADGRAYSGLSFGTMQGNFGPGEKMATAIGAFTPNTPWAALGCRDLVDMDGEGTSAATPQVAAAAALWIAKNIDRVMQYSKPWHRIVAVRDALFGSAHKSTAAMNAAETRRTLGQGVLDAPAALARTPATVTAAHRVAAASHTPLWLAGVLTDQFGAVDTAVTRDLILLELAQMAQIDGQLDAAWPGDRYMPPDDPRVRRYLETALDLGRPSQPLRAVLERVLSRTDRGLMPHVRGTPIRRKVLPQPPPRRRLRIYALDPALAKRLDTLPVNETVIELPWEDTGPGPVGSYLEVVDVDPASGMAYAPVNLDDVHILAERGLPPSEGDPKFHQQMVYAVAMRTIATFERALGRRVLWVAPPLDDRTGDNPPSRRLRIYPHALRAANAWYSPDKVALLFGYFPSTGGTTQATPAGSMVFTCLSSDIVVHEMTHAILDGMHRRFQERSNPDVAAFHEGFADIVAIFHHFSVRELVRFEIARARGDLTAARLLAGLGGQFGSVRGIGSALRDYLGEKTRARRYETTQQVHDRGEILVLAVYDAFLAIVARRTADLVRIATGGTGVLAEGSLHPDLVERLTDETCKSAEHVLRMCIRALDYVPPVDITFGDYLRALITADVDIVPDDPMGYRVAFMESFQRRGIPVRDVRTFSVETLTWNTPENDRPEPVMVAPGKWGNTSGTRPRQVNWLQDVSRWVRPDMARTGDPDELNRLNRENRFRARAALQMYFGEQPHAMREFGLVPGLARYDSDGRKRVPGKVDPVTRRRSSRTVANTGGPVDIDDAAAITTFDVHQVRASMRVAPDGRLQKSIVVVITQRIPVFSDRNPGEPGEDGEKPAFWFRGGATVVIDADQAEPRIRYVIMKSMESGRRLAIQRETSGGGFVVPLRESYFGFSAREPFAMLHQDHEEHGHGP
jgi:hypothetical protein